MEKTITPSGYIEFPDGIFGFEEEKKFLPVMLEEDSDAVLYLQSERNEHLAFVVMNPFLLKEDYHPVLSETDREKLEASSEEELSYYCLCVVGASVEESTVNLKCPIVVNTVTRKARQVILDSEEYGFRHYLKEFGKAGTHIC
ncbi:MAG: flagellar assembly protein FliW [Lachnospiraceae bacterium]|jgi:flagellar assembly factor FliW|nr:flagellar assembly protein FliW [Lachnospiraceae bacterium]